MQFYLILSDNTGGMISYQMMPAVWNVYRNLAPMRDIIRYRPGPTPHPTFSLAVLFFFVASPGTAQRKRIDMIGPTYPAMLPQSRCSALESIFLPLGVVPGKRVRAAIAALTFPIGKLDAASPHGNTGGQPKIKALHPACSRQDRSWWAIRRISEGTKALDDSAHRLSRA